MDVLTIGELAKKARVNRETVRYYERRRLLGPPARSPSGYRVFSEDTLRRLRFIRHAKVLGFSLGEIRELLTLRVARVDACERVLGRVQAKRNEIDRKISALQDMKDALSALASACSKGSKTNECPVLDALEANGWFEETAGGRSGLSQRTLETSGGPT
jgi:MerR family transcriptional regulator, copper efflux regulator